MNNKDISTIIKEKGTRRTFDKVVRGSKIVRGLAIGLALMLIVCVIYGTVTQNQIADSVVRLHIVANSNSDADQEVKLKIRDAILEYVAKKYPNGATKEEAAKYLKNSLSEIKQIASAVLRENGSNNMVSANYGIYSFPTKEYDGLTLPAGNYEAVRVEVGEAKGNNWWCIMFPPLCVADASSLKLDEEAMGQLKDGLSYENYKLITGINEKNNGQITVKFRIVEIVEDSKMRISKLLSDLF